LFQLACGYPLYILRQFARKLPAENLLGFLALERFNHAESITLFVNNAKRYGWVKDLNKKESGLIYWRVAERYVSILNDSANISYHET
jgi:hypothetical protein